MHKIKIYSLLVMLLLLNTTHILGQVNIKVGYAGGFTKAPVLNKVVDSFNAKYNKLDDHLDQFKSLHGLEIGLRYRMNSVGFEISWNSISDRSDYIGYINQINYQKKYYMSITEFSMGLENYFGNFGYGASLGYRTAKMKTNITGAPRKKRTLMDESGFSSKFYLIYQIGGDKVGLAFKPYVQFPLTNIDISDFDADLNAQLEPAYVSPKPQEERFFLYGISIVLYNGRQVH